MSVMTPHPSGAGMPGGAPTLPGFGKPHHSLRQRLHTSWAAALGLLLVVAVIALVAALTAGGGAEAKAEVSTAAGTLLVDDVVVGDRYPAGCVESDASCRVAMDGYQVVVVKLLPKADESPIEQMADLDAFDTVSIRSSTGEETEAFLEGADKKHYYVGFTPGESEHDFQLIWKGNEPIDLPGG